VPLLSQQSSFSLLWNPSPLLKLFIFALHLGPLIIFVHGWPELSISWRHQLKAFGELGFRAVAPDLRGYGKSSVFVHPMPQVLNVALVPFTLFAATSLAVPGAYSVRSHIRFF
jgi:pimeloyl-ACP methyl ester carboxylesterase